MTIEETAVPVRRAWNAWQTTEMRVGDLDRIHWAQPPGAPRPIVHAHVAATGALVCILKSGVIPTVYAELVRRAEDQRHLVIG